MYEKCTQVRFNVQNPTKLKPTRNPRAGRFRVWARFGFNPHPFDPLLRVTGTPYRNATAIFSKVMLKKIPTTFVHSNRLTPTFYTLCVQSNNIFKCIHIEGN